MNVTGTEAFLGKINPALNKNVSLRKYFEDRKVYLINKRLFDIVFSLLVILFILSWLLPVMALLIKLTSKGPVFFIQKRVGFLGRSFNCIKFRTMVVNKEANTKQAIENDPRITRIGIFLRITSLDEFPQFFNVLMGDMSIVGPRPHMHKDCKDFARLISHYKFRNIVKPGITGLAQVKGFRGPAKDMESIFGRYQWDSFYVRNWTFVMDLRIMRQTVTSTFSVLFSRIFIQKIKRQSQNYFVRTNKYLN